MCFGQGKTALCTAPPSTIATAERESRREAPRLTISCFRPAGKFVISCGADGSVFISRALPDQLAIPAPPVPDSGPVYDVDAPDESLQLDEVRL